MKHLIEAGADVNRCAFLHDLNLKIVRILLCSGIQVNLKEDNETTLSHCIKILQKYCYINTDEIKQKIKLLHAAGETITTGSDSPELPDLKINVERETTTTHSETTDIPDFLKHEIEELNLMSICREVIRKHLLQMSLVNLFYRVPRLGLPAVLCEYLLYNVEKMEDLKEYYQVHSHENCSQ